VNRFDSLRVLHRQRSDGRHSIAAVGRKCFQVGANAGAATGIKSRNSQKNGRNGNFLGVKVAHHRYCGASRGEENGRSRSSEVKFRSFTPENGRHLRMYAH
jgi:hypothetical protein